MTESADALDLLYTDVEDSLRDSLRSLLEARCTPERVTAVYDGDDTLREPLWRAIAVDVGLAGLLVAEENGGAGASAREAAVVLEELGRFVAPAPFLTSSVVATTALRSTDDAALLAALAAGERTVALAVPWSTDAHSFEPRVRLEDGGLRGRITSVADGATADALLVPVAAGAGVELHLVETSGAGVAVAPVVSLDMTRPIADVELTGAASTVVVGADSGDRAVRDALLLGAALLASEQAAIARRCLETTVAYLGERRQFGRIVGGYQALKHRLADLYVLVESATAAARYAAATAAADDPDLAVAASMAQAYCSDVAVLAAEECLQLHGGIGMTWEHPTHLYLKRAKADQIALGSTAAHHARLAELVDLLPTA